MTESDRTILLSDIHMGLATSRSDLAAELVGAQDFSKLIILGDLYNGNLDYFRACDYALLDALRKVRGRLVLVRGNHDPYLITISGLLENVPACDTYAWECAGIKCFAAHGHQWDPACAHSNLIQSATIFVFTKAVDKNWLDFADERFADKLAGSPDSAKIIQGACTLAASSGAKAAFCGHTHEATTGSENGVAYINTGCWLGDIATYGVVDSAGARLEKFGAS